MKKHIVELIMGCLLLICFYYLSREAAAVSVEMNQKQVIVVDCGHGGMDPGMIGIDGLKEKDVNLAIGLKVKSALEKKDYQMLITGVYNSYSPDLTYFFGENNISNYRNENILSILSSGISTKSSKVLKEKYSEIYNTYKAEVPFIGLYRSKNITITSEKLIGEIIVNNYSTFYNISNWYRK